MSHDSWISSGPIKMNDYKMAKTEQDDGVLTRWRRAFVQREPLQTFDGSMQLVIFYFILFFYRNHLLKTGVRADLRT